MATVMATLVTGSTRHTQALEATLGSVNDRLKQAKRRVRVVVPSKKHRTLHLRATLPPRTDEVQGPPRRRYIKLPFEYTQGGIQEAEVQAIELDRDITDWRNGQDFDWDNWKEPEKRKRSDEV